MSRMIIAVDESERSKDALAFGSALAREGGVAVTLAHAYPWQQIGFTGGHPGALGSRYEANRVALEQAEGLLAKLSEALGDLPGLETRIIADASPARALQSLAEELDAGMIVLGSSHTGRLGRVLPGSTAERLLHGAPCPVAVVPYAFRMGKQHGVKTIACAWDGSPESEAALGVAEELAGEASASLRVIRVFEPTSYLYPTELAGGYADFRAEARKMAQDGLTRRMEHIPASVDAQSDFHEGLADHDLVELSETVDLMVLGSRGYGPLKAVLLGGVSGKVVREAGCPVIVVPNGIREPAPAVVGANGEAAVR